MESVAQGSQKRFSVRRINVSPGVKDRVSEEELVKALLAHQEGDWGDVPEDDRHLNEENLRETEPGFDTFVMSCFPLRHEAGGQAARAGDPVDCEIMTFLCDEGGTWCVLPEEYR